ncbi:MAG: HAMP domain-containing protein [Desulfuromonas sp.]|nr:HAMP domain-containing protein [Desulfuromonas sp.]
MNVVLLTFGIGFFAAFHYKRDQQNMVDLTIEGAEILMATIENAIFNSKCKGDPERLQKNLQFISRSPNLLGVRIFSAENGLVLNSSQGEEIDQPVPVSDLAIYNNGRTSGIVEIDSEQVLSIIKPIIARPLCSECHGVEKKVLGVLNLNYSMRETNSKLASSSRCFSLSMVFITLLLSVGVSVILLRFVRKPIQVMTSRMAKVEAGDLKVRMVPKHNDEIAHLMRSFNSMVEKLDVAKQELETYHFSQMEQADRLASIGEMATGMAHEIKNPLAGISGAVTVLADDLPQDDDRRQVVQDILAQIARLNKTATDLLNFGRPGLPQCDYLDVNDVVKETLFFVAQHPEAKNIHQITELTRDLPPVWADRKQIQQVLLNIIINALQAMPECGSLTVQTELTREHDGRSYVRVQIVDTGSGIPVERLDKIFTPFFTTKNRGTGLGLAICKQLIKQNDGHISVLSSPQEGTSFSISLPVAKLPESGQEEEQNE